ncbi:MAG: Sua5/YciO/YrdC/YwlC family protein [Cyanobacteriota bacterium]|nr:Sua5/YciO/YrdC/YwlC family protein [Cyanobacteriota bacterium]
MSGSAEPEARLLLDCHGVVQGVGARPALRRLAEQLGLRGRLRNRLGVLRLDLCGPTGLLERFLAALPAALPAAARLERLEARWLAAPATPWPAGLVIAADRAQPLGCALPVPGLSADRAPCPACLAELVDPTSRRHRYPFISCCACGPRFSLATALPFRRAHTTFAAFPPCAACAAEFSDPTNRRCHAETISCHACGPRLRMLDPEGRALAVGEPALQAACDLLRQGRILALQGVGGFQLLVDARQPAAVARLRHRKHRPSKPFALLVADPRQLAAVVHCSPPEEGALRHPAAPIVLLRRRFSGDDSAWEPIAPGSPALGVMLPASGLHQLLARELDRPLVATSGNRGGEPLCIAPEEALERLAGIADGYLVHNLPIARPLDDSLLQLIDGRPALLRRARGFVPEPLPWRGPQARPLAPTEAARPTLSANTNSTVNSGSSSGSNRNNAVRSAGRNGTLLALGGDLKAAPALVSGDQIWLAPHLGDLANAAVQRRWQNLLDAQLTAPPRRPRSPDPAGAVPGLSSQAPTQLACDAHPGYLSQQLARPLAKRHQLRLTTVPHHLAHGLAVLAERGEQPPLLVVACDGLGLADPASPPGQERLWGGELLWVEGIGGDGLRWRRLAALRPFPLPGGERASREPRRCALGLLANLGPPALNHPGASRVLDTFPADERALLLAAIASGCNAPLTSSLGRLVDGVASLLGLAHTLSHEGEGGLRWQGAAARGARGRHRAARSSSAPPWRLPLRPSPPAAPDGLPLGRWDWEPLLWALLAHQAAGGRAEEAAWRVERALVRAIVRGAGAGARWSGCRRVALTGGCFQNRTLLEDCAQGLRRGGWDPLWAEQVPCNDGGLALGQAWAAQADQSGL